MNPALWNWCTSWTAAGPAPGGRTTFCGPEDAAQMFASITAPPPDWLVVRSFNHTVQSSNRAPWTARRTISPVARALRIGRPRLTSAAQRAADCEFRSQRGFSLIELIIVILLMGLLSSIMIPNMRPSPLSKVRFAAQTLARDLELVRTRALSTKKSVRMLFSMVERSYVGFIDDDRDGIIDESVAETRALRARGRVTLAADVLFGRGTAVELPGISGAGPITFADGRIHLNGRGILMPFGTRGAVYLIHRDYPDAVAAVSVSASGSFKAWSYVGGEWR
ncbi:MAG: prepilin-type N-terminal cleavage/methylation domain-containing protein [Gemmatimonadetes bacterium]|nr:prepilin-type N-terminal cleavage/methylation domain-containing protein [Gemmatimonadota bacterium]